MRDIMSKIAILTASSCDIPQEINSCCKFREW